MKPPWYEEMDHGRELAITEAFARVCGAEERYEFIILPPTPHPRGWCGPLPRHSFQVQERASGEVVAVLHPDGRYECRQAEFRPFLEQIETIVERAGQEAYDSFMEKYERLRRQG